MPGWRHQWMSSPDPAPLDTQIRTNTKPTASFTIQMATSAAPAPAILDAAASGDSDGRIVSYNWRVSTDAGVCATFAGADLRQVNYTFAQGSRYVVRLTVTDDKGASANRERSVWPGELQVQATSRDFAEARTQHTLTAANVGGSLLTVAIGVKYVIGPGGWLRVAGCWNL